MKRTIEGDITDLIPSSFLQTHRRAKIVLDLSAAEALTRISRPWLVTSCEWDEKLIRRAIVWLCKVTGKPILKLTDKDYNDNGLSELVALSDRPIMSISASSIRYNTRLPVGPEGNPTPTIHSVRSVPNLIPNE